MPNAQPTSTDSIILIVDQLDKIINSNIIVKYSFETIKLSRYVNYYITYNVLHNIYKLI